MKKLVLLFVLALSFSVFAQEWDEVSIYDIQYLPDSVIALGDAPSPLNGDTVLVTGVCMVAPIVDAQNDRRPIIYAGSRWVTFAQDAEGNQWAGINVIQDDTTGDYQQTGFQNLDTAQVFKFYAVVNEYYTTTQASILLDPITEIEVVDQLAKRPDPIQLEMTDFMENGQIKRDAEKWEGMYVEIKGGFTSDRNSSTGTFTINDGEGNYCFMYDQSGYFTNRTHRLTGLTEYEAPRDGSSLVHLRGVLSTRDDGFYISPLYPGDLETDAKAPFIVSVDRSVAYVATQEPVQITAEILPGVADLTETKLFYSFNGAPYDSVNMSLQSGSVYQGFIPGTQENESYVRYFVKAVNDSGYALTLPFDTTYTRYFYMVKDGALTIKDVQYSPYNTGYSSMNGYEATVEGVVTGIMDDFDENYVFIQMPDGGPWSGIRLIGAATEDLQKGDMVKATGIVNENYSVTTIGTVEEGVQLEVLSSGNSLPAYKVLSTGDIGTVSNGTIAGEQWEGTLVQYNNLEVTNNNADGSNNYGEIFVSDGSGDTRIEVEEGNHFYHNGYDPALMDSTNWIYINTGDTFTSIKGMMYFSFSNYKLIPMAQDDFQGHVVDIEADNDITPESFSLSQNYPNPFNPATKIEFNIPNASKVSLKVYDILGQQVAELVNDYKVAGKYTVSFNAAALSSGVYFYRLEAGEFNSVKKMVLLK